MTRLGYQIPNFTIPGVTGSAIFQNVVDQAKAALQAVRSLTSELPVAVSLTFNEEGHLPPDLRSWRPRT